MLLFTGAPLALGGCFSSDLTQFNVAVVGAVAKPGEFTLLGVTHASFINSASKAEFAIGGVCGDEGRAIRVRLASAGTLSDQIGTCSGGTWSVSEDYSGLSEGTVSLSARWDDSPEAEPQLLSLFKDTVAPSVILTTLNGGQVIAGGSSQAIDWGASDENPLPAAPVSIQSYHGSTATWTTIASNEANDGTYAWSVPMINGTTYQVQVSVTDAAGNVGTAKSSSNFTIDSTTPSVTINTAEVPSGYINKYTEGAFTVSGTCSENGQAVTFNVVYPGGSFTAPAPICSGGNWTADLDFTLVTEGDVTISVTHTDAAGNPKNANLATRTLDRTPPDSITVSINSDAARTGDHNVLVVADAGGGGTVERYVTNDPLDGCTTGGTWQTSDSGPFAWKLGNHLAGTYSVYARFRDEAGNETNCPSSGFDSIELFVLDVVHAYPGKTLWNDYALIDFPLKTLLEQSGSTCFGSEMPADACFHAGAQLKVELPSESDCTGLSLTDTEDAFVWRCATVSGVVTFHNQGFRHWRGLAHLVGYNAGFYGWKPMKVLLTGGVASTPTNSAPHPWWSNAVEEAPESASAVRVLGAGVGPSTVWVVPAGGSSGSGYNLGADNISLVTLPGDVYEFTGTANNCYESNGQTTSPNKKCVIAASDARKFLWIEGSFRGGTGAVAADYGMVLTSKRSRVHRFHYAGPDTSPGSIMGLAANSLTVAPYLSDIRIARVRGSGSTGLRIDSVRGASLEGVSVSDSIYCIWLNSPGTDPVVARNLRVSNCSAGLMVQGTNAAISGVLASHTSNAISTAANNARFTMITTGRVNNASNNFIVNGSSTGTIVHQMLTHSEVRGFSIETSATDVTLSEAAFSRISTTGNMINNTTASGTLKVTGALLLPASGNTCDGNSDLNADCTALGNSNHTLFTDLNLSSTFYGKLSSNDPEFSGTSASYDSLVNWFKLGTPYRTFGSATTGMCTSGQTCSIWDWRLLDTDTQILGRSTDPAGARVVTLTDGASCPTDGGIGETLLDYYGFTAYLRTAVELLFDRVGDDDGLCEQDEHCLFTPNYGAYQGTGDYLDKECTLPVLPISGIRLFGLPTNGVTAGSQTPEPFPGLGTSKL